MPKRDEAPEPPDLSWDALETTDAEEPGRGRARPGVRERRPERVIGGPRAGSLRRTDRIGPRPPRDGSDAE